MATIRQRASAACSKYIRLKYSKDGNCTCVTCGVTKPIKEMQAGHFVDGRRNAILFDERNVHPQCFKCNMKRPGCLAGNIIEYYPFMLKKYGQTVIDELKANKHKVVKYSNQDFLEIEKEFLRKIEELNK